MIKKIATVLLGAFCICLLTCGSTNIEPVNDNLMTSNANFKEKIVEGGYWLYIAPFDKIATNSEDNAGRHKKGDIVEILPCTKQFQPSEREKDNYIIVRVESISREDILKYTESWVDMFNVGKDTTYEDISYRRYKVDVDKLNYTTGLDTVKKDFDSTIKPDTKLKTSFDLIGYDMKMYAKWAVSPLGKIADWLIPPVYAAESVTTCNHPGEDYNTLILWESTEDGTMLDGTDNVVECYDDDGVLSSATELYINGWTGSDPDTRIIIRTATGEKHTGQASTGFEMLFTGSSPNSSLETNEDYVILDGLDINHGGIESNAVGIDNTGNIVINCIIRNGTSRGINIINGGGAGIIIYNNLIYDTLIGIFIATNEIVLVYNNTSCNNSSAGIRAQNSGGDSSYVSNNACFDNDVNDFANTDRMKVGSTNNVSSDISAASEKLLNGLISKTAANNFVDSDSRNYKVVNTSADIYDYGVDLSGTFTDDILGNRRVTWDVGAFEYWPPIQNYTKGDNVSLPTGDADLETGLTDDERDSVSTEDSERAVISGAAGEYSEFLFKDRHTQVESFILTWNGQSSTAPSTATVYLQVYNRNTPGWETVDSDNSTAANIDFTLSGSISTSLSDYFDANYVLSCRVYQLLPALEVVHLFQPVPILRGSYTVTYQLVE